MNRREDRPVHENPTELSPVKRALLEIRDLKARLAQVQGRFGEPVAIVGLGCRLPGGVVDADTLWQALHDGVDAVGDIPPGRWDVARHLHPDPDHPGTMVTHRGGFLEQVDGFDAAFFGISPREAERMDPQQRLFLEVAWQALENAAIAPDRLAGSATGVFAGVGNTDYSRILFGQPQHVDAYAGSGGSASVIPGRLSYVLGLQGPSLAVDTACSASLVAVHLACQSLRSGESDLALAGGVNLILGPEAHIAFTKARMLAPDGRCKAFDARADGYGRGEGCVVVVLRRLSDAQARGERILAVIRGSAVNQDGRSGGLTAPNGPAQEAVIAAALAAAGLQPHDIDVVEAHGTGTALGDPIELQALGAVLAAGRDPGRPLLVGSAKTNFGHLEAAAGLAGLAKLVVAMQHGEVPAHLHFQQPNPLIDWARWPVRIAAARCDWPAHGRPRRAGVSSFGFSGTNAHVILESAPPPAAAAASTEAPARRRLLALSAQQPAALRQLAEAYEARLVQGADPLHRLCATANAGRAHLSHRLAVTGHTHAELAAALAAWREGRADARWAASPAEPGPAPVVAWVFTGQGAQRIGMGRTLYARSAVFRQAFDDCAAVLDPLLPRPLRAVVHPEDEAQAREAAGLIDQTQYAQAALFALEYALAALWRDWGVTPAVVLGHSVGEVVAACVAGVLPLEAAARLVAARGQLMQALPAGGAMANVFCALAQAEPVARRHGIEFAAFNGPAHQVLSGPRAAVEAACGELAAQGVRCSPLAVSHAFHSGLMEPMLDAFEQALVGLPFAPPRLTLVSNLTAAVADPSHITQPAYWREHVRRPVRFAESVHALLRHGVTHVIEIGPSPVLLGMAARALADEAAGVVWLPSLRERDDDGHALLAAVQALYVAGQPLRWDRIEADAGGPPLALPTYPFQHRRHWVSWQSGGESLAADPVAQADHVWRSLAAAVERQAGQAPLGVAVERYAATWQVLERLTTAHAAEALRAGGLFARPGEVADVAAVRMRLGAAATYDHLIGRWLQRLAASGWLQRDGDRYASPAPLPDPGLAACQAAAAQALADDPPLRDYLGHCGRLLADVIGGRQSPLETLFPGGSFELAEGLYERSGPARYVNGLAAAALQAVVAARGPGAGLRVLEIGAGTGSTSASLVPLLPPGGRSSYWFTDVTPVFLDRARDKFAAYPGVRFQAFDLERDPAAQGVPVGSFDVVVAANAVHAVRDLRAALRRLHGLLAPGGVLMLLESTEHLDWFDMSTGLIEGWQHFEDDLRGDHPLLAPARWADALAEAGFTRVRAWPDEASPAAAIGQHLVVAGVPGGVAAADAAEAEAGAQDAGAQPSRHEDWPARLAAAVEAERIDLLRNLVRDAVMRILHLDDSQAPSRHDRLMDLGFDSLMAVQLRGQLGRDLGLAEPLPATLMFDHPTIDAIAAFLLGRLAPPASPDAAPFAAASPPVPAVPGDDRLRQVSAMSDAEIEALLLERLNRP